MNKKHIALIVIMVLLSIVLVIGGTYAFYIATITGNDTAEEITITSGYLELTFAEDGNNIVMKDVLPNSKSSKTFTVENTSTANAEFTYNIKLAEVETDFEQKDLEYVLQEYTNDNYDEPKEDGKKATGFINKNTINEDGEMYLAIKIPAPAKGKKQYYKLTIEFKETDKNQDYNKGKSFTGKINGDDNRDAALYKDSMTFSEIMQVDNKNIFDGDPAKNIRYAGPSAEVNNYIWFNCNDYNAEMNKTNCERWRIIGLFKDVTKVAGGTEDLVKIIRVDSIGDMYLNSSNVNNWTTSSVQKTLNTTYYNGTDFQNGKGITVETRGMIEQVTWNIGGHNTSGATALQFYGYERGNSVVGGAPSIWNGYIGLMYPSDYGYATAGGDTTDRDTCLTANLNTYGSDCYQKDWMFDSTRQWMISPCTYNSRRMFNVAINGGVADNDVHYQALYGIRPTLYLKSNVKVVDGKGTSDEPYILSQEN